MRTVRYSAVQGNAIASFDFDPSLVTPRDFVDRCRKHLGFHTCLAASPTGFHSVLRHSENTDRQSNNA